MGQTKVGPEAIRKQMEFYFSDSNIPRDRYLQKKIAENTDGFVNISDLLTFNRLKELNATQASIVEALRPSKLLEVDKEQSRVRRTTPLPANSLFATRAVFVKGWLPGSKPPSVDELISMFSPFGTVLRVNSRYWTDEQGRHFRGSVFVEMESPEAAERVVADEFTITTTENGQQIEKTLLTELMPDYMDRKKKEGRHSRKNGKKNKKLEQKDEALGENGEQTEDGDNSATRNHNGKAAIDSSENKPDQNNQGNANGEGESESAKNETDELTFESGLILRLEELSTEVSREDIREVVEVHGDITFIDFNRGQTEGFIRFADAVSAKHAYQELTKAQTKFCGVVPKISPVEGDAEVAYWREVKNRKQNFRRKRDRDSNHRGGGRSWKRGRRSSGRGRGRNDART